jgi:hypothetical protein
LLAALTRVLDEAVRDEVIARNPARDRANRRYRSAVTETRERATLPTLDDMLRIAEACRAVHQSYADHVTLCAFLAARGAEVSGLRVSDGTTGFVPTVSPIRRSATPGDPSTAWPTCSQVRTHTPDRKER